MQTFRDSAGGRHEKMGDVHLRVVPVGGGGGGGSGRERGGR